KIDDRRGADKRRRARDGFVGQDAFVVLPRSRHPRRQIDIAIAHVARWYGDAGDIGEYRNRNSDRLHGPRVEIAAMPDRIAVEVHRAVGTERDVAGDDVVSVSIIDVDTQVDGARVAVPIHETTALPIGVPQPDMRVAVGRG